METRLVCLSNVDIWPQTKSKTLTLILCFCLRLEDIKSNNLNTSHFERENVCPKCSLPFIYGKGNVAKYFSSPFLLIFLDGGALISCIFCSSHWRWISFSICRRYSTLTVPLRVSVYNIYKTFSYKNEETSNNYIIVAYHDWFQKCCVSSIS
jgi:hypothetical protein